ncbi:MAG TPA: hypothetical protein VFR41_13335 [Acidimicrobiia bacterium]|nr:hypothetical protein [Acidimicrobiia bacterium]
MDDKYLMATYIAYAAAALTLTIWLARTLYRNGAVFLEEVFDRKEIAVAVNRLLVTGFFMINLGYAMFLLKSNEANSATQAVELLVQKLGILLLTLAAVHFVNVYVFWRMRRRNEVRHLPPPVMPQRHVMTGV